VQAEAVINQAVAAHGRVDGVVNCVGSIVLKSAHTTSDADFEQVGSSRASSNTVVCGSSRGLLSDALLLTRLAPVLCVRMCTCLGKGAEGSDIHFSANLAASCAYCVHVTPATKQEQILVATHSESAVQPAYGKHSGCLLACLSSMEQLQARLCLHLRYPAFNAAFAAP
jgi:NAD(P)-dependent dehydrogenase (short-subunit alcohol dehydrogenase family)